MKWTGKGISVVGKQREDNEDRFFIDNYNHFYIVADGMGGVEGGEIAAQMVVDQISKSIKYLLKKTPDITHLQFQLMLQESIHAINDLIYRYGVENEMPGMGSTMVMAVVQEDRTLIAHIGDSRCYCVSDHLIMQITQDHACDESSYEITRAIGAKELVVADIQLIKLKANDRLLLCSDGLNHMINDEFILKEFRFKTPITVCRRLVESANQAGGEDNITCVVIQRVF